WNSGLRKITWWRNPEHESHTIHARNHRDAVCFRTAVPAGMQEEKADSSSAPGASSNHYGPAVSAYDCTGRLFQSDCDPASAAGSLNHNSKATAAETEE